MMWTDTQKIYLRKAEPVFEKILIFVLIAVLVAILPSIVLAGEKVIKIGGTLPLTGPAAEDGTRFFQGRKLAVEKINEKGGVLGRKLELIIRDDGMEPGKVASLYESLIRDQKVDLLVTSYGSPMTMPAMGAAEKYDKLMISAYSSSVSLIEAFGGKNFFGVATQPKDSGYINWWYRGMTDFLWDFDSWNHKPGFPKPKSMFVLNENQLFGIEQHDLWRPYVDAQGWNVVHDEFVEWTQMEFSALISKIKALKPDVIYVNFFFFRAIPLIKQFREQRVTANFIMLPEAGTRMDWTDPKTGAGKVGNGIFCFALFSKTYHGGGADDFRSSYQAMHGYRPGFLEATGYADIQVIAQAVELAGSTKTEDVRAALLKGEFETCYTPVKFDSSGLNELWNPVVGQWIDDELENVYPEDAQTHKPVYPYAPPR